MELTDENCYHQNAVCQVPQWDHRDSHRQDQLYGSTTSVVTQDRMCWRAQVWFHALVTHLEILNFFKRGPTFISPWALQVLDPVLATLVIRGPFPSQAQSGVSKLAFSEAGSNASACCPFLLSATTAFFIPWVCHPPKLAAEGCLMHCSSAF